MSLSTVEIMNKGMQCLLDELGVVDTEHFISVIIKEQFDYTKWQQKYFDNMTPDEINRDIEQYMKKHPFKGNAKTII